MKISQLLILLLLFTCAWGTAQSFAVDDSCGSVEGTAERIQCVNDKAFTEAKIKNYPEGQLKETCEARWGVVHEELLSCLETQTEARLEIKDAPETMKVRCQAQWSTDYELTKHCIERAIESEALKAELQELTPPLPTGLPTVLRYVPALKGPFVVEAVNLDSSLRLSTDSLPTVRMNGFEVMLPQKTQALLVRRLQGKEVWLESVNGANYIYAESPKGEWTGDGARLVQINLMLVENGLVRPSSNISDTGYAHFYTNAMARAEFDGIGAWGNR